MVMLRNIMEGRYSFTSPEWDDITGILYDLLLFFLEDLKDLCFMM